MNNLYKKITILEACRIACREAKNIFEPNSGVWNNAIDAVVKALKKEADNE